MTTRRDFLRNLAAIGAVAGSPKLLFFQSKVFDCCKYAIWREK